MILIGLADIHGHTAFIDKMSATLASADVVLVLGDITNFGDAAAAGPVIEKIRQHAKTVLAVSGNCDYGGVDDYLNREAINLHGKGRMIGHMGFMGLGGSLVTPFHTPNEYTENDLSQFLEAGRFALPADSGFILVSHQPPYGTECDQLRTGQHVGSRSVRSFIEKYRPVICFTGHIHESRGTDILGSTRVVNPGPLSSGRYAHAEITSNGAVVEVRSVL